MKPKTCENCSAFKSRTDVNAKQQDGSVAGECHALPPVLLSTWMTPQGAGWSCGWPAVSSSGWCRQHETELDLVN
jgi:hypothetical protein